MNHGKLDCAPLLQYTTLARSRADTLYLKHATVGIGRQQLDGATVFEGGGRCRAWRTDAS